MKYIRLCTELEVQDVITQFASQKSRVAIDLETTGLNPRVDKIVEIALCGDEEIAYLFPAEFVSQLSYLYCEVILHNFKFDFAFLEAAGVVLPSSGTVVDTMLMHHLIDENKEHSLDSIVKEEFQDDYKEQFWAKYKTYEEAPEQERLEYACKDVIYTRRLYFLFVGYLRDDGVPTRLVDQVHALAIDLYETETMGVLIDVPYMIEVGTELTVAIKNTKGLMLNSVTAELEQIEMQNWLKEINKFKTDAKRSSVERPSFNFDSPAQMSDLLYGKLGLPVQFNPKTRKPSTDDNALKKLGNRHPLITHIRDHRKQTKMYTSFIGSLSEKLVDGRIYPSFRVNGTVTGRISAHEPNMQQMPSRGEWTKIRGIFIPDAGHKIITADYGQLEICLAAHYSNDPVLIDMIRKGESMHDRTAKACGITREQAKKMNFSVLYGATEHKIADDLGCSVDQATGYLQVLLGEYAGLKRLMDTCHGKVDKGEPIVNAFGRRRRFPTKFDNRWDKMRAKRQSFNALIQGTGADMTHLAFIRVAHCLRTHTAGRALFPVHDEIVIQCLNDQVEEGRKYLKDCMLMSGDDIGMKIPLTVEVSEPLERWQK